MIPAKHKGKAKPKKY